MGKKYSQLTLEKRIEIQMMLQSGARSFAEIGRKVGVSPVNVHVFQPNSDHIFQQT